MRAHHTVFTLLLMLPAAAVAGIPQDLALAPFASGLDSPVALRHAGDGSGRVYVVQRPGVVAVFNASGTYLGDLLDIDPLVSTEGEGGLLGLAFHPDFPTDPRVFVYYTDNSIDTVVASYTVSGNPPVANPASAQVLLRVDQDFSNHNGGDIHFGSDGYLYIGLGDGGSGNDPCNRAQTLDPAALSGQDSGGGGTSAGGCDADDDFLAGGAFAGNPDSRALLGKMLRIDVDGTTGAGANGLCGASSTGAGAYAIPADNPFASGGTANGCDEVWHYGLRNPYRFSFDRANGDLYIGDVGQGWWEEIDYAAFDQGGLNFGWDACEGAHATGTAGDCTLPGATLPILEYANGDDCAVTGGFRYRGPIAALVGDYVFGDFCSGRIWIASGSSGGSWSAQVWTDTSLLISGFGEDESGNLYVAHLGGSVQRLVAPAAIFGNGFEGD